jgi:hypothetical protein
MGEVVMNQERKDQFSRTQNDPDRAARQDRDQPADGQRGGQNRQNQSRNPSSDQPIPLQDRSGSNPEQQPRR